MTLNKDCYKRQGRTLHLSKGSIKEEDITLNNIYALILVAPQYIRQILITIEEEIDSSTIIVRDFNTLLTPKDRSSRQKICKETQALTLYLRKLEKEEQKGSKLVEEKKS